jgi:curli production assembly/transport component CsgG
MLLVVVILNGCAISQKTGITEYRPEVAPNKMQKEFDILPPPNGKKVSVAVYSFADKTGQRKPTANIASLSSAVTQGAEVFLIKALQDVGRAQWFDVVERVGIDSITKERTIIRQMREAYEGKDAKPLMPLAFAGIIMEGGIIGYDSSTESGGAAYRFLGIGPQTQYSKDTVTISLRAVSVNTGRVLVAVHVTKIVYSTADSVAVLKYIDNKNIASQIFGNAGNANSVTGGMFEFETGLTINEPGTLAVKATVEAAVVELIKEGERKGVWEFKREEARNDVKPATTVAPPAPTPVAEQPAKKEEARPVTTAAADPKEIARNPINPVAVVRGPTPQPTVAVLEKRPGETVADSVKRVQAEVNKQEPTKTQVWLKQTEYIYKETRETSQKTWQFPKGTELTVVAAQGEWLQVKDVQGRGGWVVQQAVTATPPEKSVPEVKKEVKK